MDIEPTRELVLKKLRDCFPDAAAAAAAMETLDSYDSRPWAISRERVQLAILMESHGFLHGIRQMVDLAHRDFRDVLVGAEYPEQFRAPRNTPFEEMESLRKRDRNRYEKWLLSDAGSPPGNP